MTMKKIKRTTTEYINTKGEHETSIVTEEEWMEPVGTYAEPFAPLMPFTYDPLNPWKVTSDSITSLGVPAKYITGGTIPADAIKIKVDLNEVPDMDALLKHIEKALEDARRENGGMF